jgi:hypothetical protein
MPLVGLTIDDGWSPARILGVLKQRNVSYVLPAGRCMPATVGLSPGARRRLRWLTRVDHYNLTDKSVAYIRRISPTEGCPRLVAGATTFPMRPGGGSLNQTDRRLAAGYRPVSEASAAMAAPARPPTRWSATSLRATGPSSSCTSASGGRGPPGMIDGLRPSSVVTHQLFETAPPERQLARRCCSGPAIQGQPCRAIIVQPATSARRCATRSPPATLQQPRPRPS